MIFHHLALKDEQAELPKGKDADSAHSHGPSEGAQPATSLRCSAIGGQRSKCVAVPLHFVAKELVGSGLRSRLPGDGMLRRQKFRRIQQADES